MKIVRLEAANVKRLKAVQIEPDPDGSLVVIRGDNGQGKTSVLDSIAYALGGKGLQPPKVIRDGTREAYVVLELDDLVVERRWSSNEKTYLEVRSREGAPLKSPQALLDSLVGRLSFDPLSFLRLEPKAQADALRVALGIDFSALESERARAFGERTTVNRELERAKARLASMPPAAKVERVDVGALLKEQEALQTKQRQGERLELAVKQAEAMLDAAARQLDALDAELKRVSAARAEAIAEEETKKKRLAEARAAAEAAEDVDLELMTVRDRLAAAEATNAAARKVEERKTALDQVAELEKASNKLSDAIHAVDQEKAKALKGAKFPVPELAFTENGLTLAGVPFEQASGAEQLRVSVAMGLAANPKLKVLLVRDGSLLDANSTKLLGELAHQAGAQVWLEVVGKGDVGVIIEDGQVA